MIARPRRRITTERLTLVATDRSHASGLNRAMRASLDELSPWMSWVTDPSLEQTRSFTFASEDRWDRSMGWNFTILCDGEPCGTVGLDQYQPMLDSAEMGYWIRSDLAGKGLMKEAARAAVDFAFEDIEMHRLELHASPENHASVRVAEAIGFQREGLARHIAKGAFGFYDCLTFGLLATDPRG